MRSIIIFSITMLLLTVTTLAQEQSYRIQKQHHLKYIESQLNQTENMLLMSLQRDNTGIVSSSVQTLRELEQLFPKYEFSSLLNPLITILENEKGTTSLRILTALALDGLHSDKGDAVIYKVAKTTKDKSLKDVCNALSIESLKSQLTSMPKQ
jgi:hypothetical protein